MIAVSPVNEKFLSCKETLIETYVADGKIEIVIPAAVDLFTCLKEGVSTIKLEVVRQNDQQTRSNAKTIDQINTQLKLASAVSYASADSASVLASRNIDITRLVPNTVAKGRTFAGSSRVAVASLLPTRTKIVPSQLESVATPVSQGGQTDRALTSSFKDPALYRTGHLPLDTVSAISATSFDTRAGVAVVPVGLPKTKIVLADPTRIDVKLKISYTGTTRDLVGCKIRVTVRAKNSEAQVLTLRPPVTAFAEVSDVPVLPPDVTGAFNEFGKARIFVTQRDKLADSVTVAARAIKDYSRPITGFETVVESVSCKINQTIAIDLPITGPSIVRVHPARSDAIAAVFGSVVLGKIRRGVDRHSSTSSSSLVVVNTPSGISIDLVTNEQQVEAALVRRLDVRSRTYETLTKSPIPASSVTSLIDDRVEDLAIVKYEVDLYKTNGSVLRRAAVSEQITRIEPREIVAADVTVTPIVEGNQVVKISIVPTIKQNDVNFLIAYVKELGLEAAFQTDLETLRKSLLDCVKFDVTRYDMQTGDAKYVGQTSNTLEDDIDDVKITSKYLYVFDAFVRSPAQLTDVINDRVTRPVGSSPKITKIGLHITKADIDKIGTSNSSLSDARRFFSRSNFETGTMPSQAATDSFRDGRTGDIFSSRVTVTPILPAVTAVEVKSVRNVPVILWKVTGNTRLIDRYVVSGTSSGATWSVATAGSAGTAASLQVSDTISHTLPRYVSYSVYPVYLDGSAGETVSADPVLIDQVREV